MKHTQTAARILSKRLAKLGMTQVRLRRALSGNNGGKEMTSHTRMKKLLSGAGHSHYESVAKAAEEMGLVIAFIDRESGVKVEDDGA